MRRPEQVLTIPFIRTGESVLYGVLHRADFDAWQGVAGGVEEDENPYQAAMRELQEELSVSGGQSVYKLTAMKTVLAHFFKESAEWDEDIYTVPEYSFAADLSNMDVDLSHEHDSMAAL